jgi:flavin reductase (DIM6/NTAB) family NADH-FMN oxidoreductase RutF
VHLRTIELPSSRAGMGNNVVLARVVGVHIVDDILRDGLVDMQRFHPVARLGYHDYTVVREVFTMARPG